MRIEPLKLAILAAWVLGVAATAASIGISSAAGWLILVGIGLLPPLLLWRMWQQPDQTMSESIRDVLK